MSSSPGLGAVRGTALYVGALLGPGLLLVPALAVQAAGPASVIAWAGLLVLSAPLAVAFATLGVRHPVAGGVSVYVREGLGDAAAAVTGMCFLAAVVVGGPAVALAGGTYVADLTGTGLTVAVAVAAAMVATVVGTNAIGLKVSSGVQLALSAVLVLVIAAGVAFAVGDGGSERWTPFAPEGWAAVGTAASLLVWHVIGWEAMAQLAGDFRDPRRDIPRAVLAAYAVIALLYAGLAVATVSVTAGSSSEVPLADLLEVGLGDAGRQATVVLALALTMGTMNVYYGGAAKLSAALAEERALPGWLAGGRGEVPHRPLALLAISGVVLLAALDAGAFGVEALVRATSACFVAVYVLALGSAVRILDGPARGCAAVALAGVLVVAAFAGPFLLVPLVAGAIALVVRARVSPRRDARRTRDLTLLDPEVPPSCPSAVPSSPPSS